MANMFQNSAQMRQNTGFYTNRFTTGISAIKAKPSMAYTPTNDPNKDQDPWPVYGLKVLAAAPVDVVDTIAALFPGVQQGQVNDTVWNAVGQPGYAQFVRDNEGAVDVASGLLGAVAVGVGAEIAVTKLVSSAWFAATGIGRAAAPLTNAVANAQRNMAQAQIAAAAAGNPLRWNQGVNLRYVGARVFGEALPKAAVSEIAIVAALHKNEVIWSDDMSSNAFWGALGLAIPMATGVIQARSAIYKWANSDVVMNEFAEAFDPGEFERLLAPIPLSGNPVQSVPKVSTAVTVNMLNAKTDAALGAEQARSGIATGAEKAAHQQLQTLTSRGTKEIKKSNFNVEGNMAGQHVREALHEDPTVFYGLDSMAITTPGVSGAEMLAEREGVITGMLASKKPSIKQKGQRLEKQVPLMLIDGTWWTIKDAEEHLLYDPTLVHPKPTAKGILEQEVTSPWTNDTFTVREDAHLKTNFQTLPITDKQMILDTVNHIQMKMLAKKEVFTLPAKPTWFQVDAAINYKRMGGEVNWGTHPQITNAETATIHSLRLKRKAIGPNATMDAATRFAFNLPQASSSERIADPTGKIWEQILMASTKKGVTTDDLKAIRLQMQSTFDFMADIKTASDLDGDFFNFNRSHQKAGKQYLTPVMGFFDDTFSAKWSRFDMANSINENKLIRFHTVLGNKASVFAKGILQGILDNPGVRTASDISGLHDAQIGGTRNAVTASASSLLTQQQRFRNNAALQAVQGIRRVINRNTENFIDTIYKTLQPHTDRLASISGSETRVLLNNYWSTARGWDILRTTQHNGQTAFVLDHSSVMNQRRLGRAVQQGELMINEKTGKIVVLDQAGDQIRVDVQKQLSALRKERNAIRAAFGLPPVKDRPFYVPPPKIDDSKWVGFVIDQAGKVVQGKTIITNSAKEYDAAASEIRKILAPGEQLYSRDEIRLHADLWEQADMDFIDPTAMAAPAMSSQGKLAGYSINPRGYEDILDYLKSGYEQVANGATRVVFDAQLKTASIRSAAERSAGLTPEGVKNIWETYQETLIGIPGTRNPVGINVPIMAGEQHVDEILATIWPRGTVSSNHIRDIFQKAGIKIPAKVKSFADLTAALGPHTPFKDAMDYAEYVKKVRIPPTVKKISRTVNRIAAGLILRWAEVPHAMMNMAGIITNMPAVLNSRYVPQIGRVKGLGVVDSAMIIQRGMKRMFDRNQGNIDWSAMVRNGDTKQDVAELHMRFSVLDGHGKFMRMMVGDPNSPSTLGKLGAEGIVSILSDTSENWSRQIMHFIGLELADYHGIAGLEARHSFARSIANDAIANYDPLNRAEIFQSGFGSMYGLFTSYINNYYQRMFRWLEDGDYRAIGTNLALQASLFGVMGLPGSRQIADFLGGEEDGTTMLENIYNRFGSNMGSVIAHGSFNEFVTIFGLPSVALHARGDANFRTPALDFITNDGVPLPAGLSVPLPPGLEAIRDIAVGLWESAGQFFDANPDSLRYATEAIARNMPSRVMKGALQRIANEGEEVDAYGNVISQTQNIWEGVYRFLGLRSMEQQGEIDAYFLNQKKRQIDAQRMDVVRERTRSMVRAKEFDRLPEVFTSYLEAGGSPANYPAWIRGLITEATNTRGENQLLKSMRGPAHQDLARRILLLTGSDRVNQNQSIR